MAGKVSRAVQQRSGKYIFEYLSTTSMIAFFKRRESLLIILAAVVITAIFFYKTILFHQIPFPGDLLINVSPYKTQSFLGYAPGGYPNLAQGMDVITEMFPWKYF